MYELCVCMLCINSIYVSLLLNLIYVLCVCILLDVDCVFYLVVTGELILAYPSLRDH
jgi:hypothetical protein